MIIEQGTMERELEDQTYYNEFIDYYYNTNLSVRNICIKMGIAPNGGAYGRIREQMKRNNDEDPIARGHRIRRKTRGEQMIKVIERSTHDMEAETIELYNQIKPLLDQGKGMYEAIREVKNIPPTSCFGNRTWYKNVRDYAISQGYRCKR